MRTTALTLTLLALFLVAPGAFGGKSLRLNYETTEFTSAVQIESEFTSAVQVESNVDCTRTDPLAWLDVVQKVLDYPGNGALCSVLNILKTCKPAVEDLLANTTGILAKRQVSAYLDFLNMEINALSQFANRLSMGC